ncbi:MAG: hypothetical protein SFY66_19540 [Oculatellaceae cyanobacterium bins.114]|nr:hypothetical protein [Oculatellaceae cyanobacterium bins.114]
MVAPQIELKVGNDIDPSHNGYQIGDRVWHSTQEYFLCAGKKYLYGWVQSVSTAENRKKYAIPDSSLETKYSIRFDPNDLQIQNWYSADVLARCDEFIEGDRIEGWHTNSSNGDRIRLRGTVDALGKTVIAIFPDEDQEGYRVTRHRWVNGEQKPTSFVERATANLLEPLNPLLEPGAEAVEATETNSKDKGSAFAEAYEAEAQAIAEIESQPAIACIDQQALESFAKLISCDLLTKDKVRGTFSWDDREWVATGGRGSGSAIAYEAVWASSVVSLEEWKEPTYSHSNLPRDGISGSITRKGQLISHKKRRLVLTGEEVEFRAGDAIAPSVRHSKPKFQQGQQLILKRSIPPLLEGSSVVVLSRERSQDDYLYEVTGRKGKVWAYESDLDNNQIAIIETPTQSITTLDTLITEINTLFGNLEEAEEVAENAAQSAFSFALEIGHKLIKAKAECGHGNWEAARAQIKSPRSGNPLPSSTATLYQRMAKRQKELEQARVCTLREAAALLKSDRSLKSATETPTAPAVVERDLVNSLEELKERFDANQAAAEKRSQEQGSETFRYCRLWLDNFGAVGELFAIEDLGEVKEGDRVTVPHGRYEGRSAVVKQIYEGDDVTEIASTAAGHRVPLTFKPSITPEEFNQEMSRGWGASGKSCYNCDRKKLGGDGSTYTCMAGQFEGDRPLRSDWATERGGCMAFERPIDFAGADIKKAIVAHGAKEVAMAALKACSEAEKAEIGNWLLDWT